MSDPAMKIMCTCGATKYSPVQPIIATWHSSYIISTWLTWLITLLYIAHIDRELYNRQRLHWEQVKLQA